MDEIYTCRTCREAFVLILGRAPACKGPKTGHIKQTLVTVTRLSVVQGLDLAPVTYELFVVWPIFWTLRATSRARVSHHHGMPPSNSLKRKEKKSHL